MAVTAPSSLEQLEMAEQVAWEKYAESKFDPLMEPERSRLLFRFAMDCTTTILDRLKGA